MLTMDFNINKNLLIYRALVAHLARRYDDMFIVMKFIAINVDNLDQLDRKLIFDAHKGRYELRQTAIDSLVAYRDDNIDILSNHEKNHTRRYVLQIEKELESIYNEMLDLIRTHLVPKADGLYFFITEEYNYFFLLEALSEELDRTGSYYSLLTMDFNKNLLISGARVAKSAGRYVDMCKIMKFIAINVNNLDQSDKNLINDAYIGRLELGRTAIDRLVTYRRDNIKQLSNDQKNHIIAYIDRIKKELQRICNEMLDILNIHLIRKAHDDDSKCLYLSLIGDYQRYLVEALREEQDKTALVNSTLICYEHCYQFSQNAMPPLNPTRLGVALNYAVFIKDILQDSTGACQLLQQVLDKAYIAILNGEELVSVSSDLISKCQNNLLDWPIEFWRCYGRLFEIGTITDDKFKCRKQR